MGATGRSMKVRKQKVGTDPWCHSRSNVICACSVPRPAVWYTTVWGKKKILEDKILWSYQKLKEKELVFKNQNQVVQCFD